MWASGPSSNGWPPRRLRPASTRCRLTRSSPSTCRRRPSCTPTSGSCVRRAPARGSSSNSPSTSRSRTTPSSSARSQPCAATAPGWQPTTSDRATRAFATWSACARHHQAGQSRSRHPPNSGQRALASALVAFAGDVGAQCHRRGGRGRGGAACVRSIGVPWAQGCYLGRPEPLGRSGAQPSAPMRPGWTHRRRRARTTF